MRFEGVVGRWKRGWLCGDALTGRLGEEFPAFTTPSSGEVLDTMTRTRRAVTKLPSQCFLFLLRYSWFSWKQMLEGL